MKAKGEYAKTMQIDLLLDDKAKIAARPVNSASADHTPGALSDKRATDFQVLLHSLYDAAILTDFEGKVLTANQRALRFFEYTLEAIPGTTIRDLIAGTDDDILATIIENVNANRFTLLQAYGIRADSSMFPAEISVTLLPVSTGNALCFFVRDITRRREVDNQLRIEGDAIRNAGNGIAISNPEGLISYANPAMIRLWQCAASADLTGTLIQSMFPASESISRAIETTRTGGNWSGELEARTADNAVFYVQASVTRCLDEDGILTNFVFSFTDITKRRLDELALRRYRDHLEELIGERTEALSNINKELETEIAERRHIEDELRQAIQKLREHDKAKSLFVSNVSHELRTPLTSLIHAIENLIRGVPDPVPDQALSYLHMMLEDCWRLDHTVNDILDLSRIEAGCLTLNTKRIAFNRMVEHTAETLRMEAESVPLAFHIEKSSQPGFVDCDAVKMERVLTNIIGNAIKFTAAGGKLSILVERESRQEQEGLCCKVTDTGIGIPPQFVARVTERFFRVGEQIGGTGLGLAIAREIVERHQGVLEIESPPPGQDQGTQVRLWLPQVPATSLLVATRDPEVCQRLCPALRDKGFETHCTERGASTLQILHDGQHRIAVIDDELADMDGIEVLMNIKADTTMHHVRIFFLTDKQPDAVRSGILEGFGVSAFLKQPDMRTLLNAIEDIDLPNRLGVQSP